MNVSNDFFILEFRWNWNIKINHKFDFSFSVERHTSMYAHSSGPRSHSICHLLAVVVVVLPYDLFFIDGSHRAHSFFLITADDYPRCLVWKVTFSISRYHYLDWDHWNQEKIDSISLKAPICIIRVVFSKCSQLRVLFEDSYPSIAHLLYLPYLHSKLIILYSCLTLHGLWLEHLFNIHRDQSTSTNLIVWTPTCIRKVSYSKIDIILIKRGGAGTCVVYPLLIIKWHILYT